MQRLEGDIRTSFVTLFEISGKPGAEGSQRSLVTLYRRFISAGGSQSDISSSLRECMANYKTSHPAKSLQDKLSKLSLLTTGMAFLGKLAERLDHPPAVVAAVPAPAEEVRVPTSFDIGAVNSGCAHKDPFGETDVTSAELLVRLSAIPVETMPFQVNSDGTGLLHFGYNSAAGGFAATKPHFKGRIGGKDFTSTDIGPFNHDLEVLGTTDPVRTASAGPI